jgi:CheY-like chemotaxis protein
MRRGYSLILILSDINMLGMTGLELLPKAKAPRPDVPVIMITAYGDADTKLKALEGGAEALLTKPIDFVALRGEIDNRVAGAGAEVGYRAASQSGPFIPPTTDMRRLHRHVSKVPYRKRPSNSTPNRGNAGDVTEHRQTHGRLKKTR